MATYDTNGLVIDTISELREESAEKIYSSSAWGPTTNLGADTALGQIVDVPSSLTGEAYQIIQYVLDSLNPNTAEGVHLENNCQMVGVTRTDSTKSVVYLTLSGTADTTIPSGTRARVPGGTIFATTSGVVLPAVHPVTDVKAEATVAGALEGGAEEVNQIVDAIGGWDYVINPSKATIGAAIESDSALRLRRASNVYGIGSCTPIALKRALEELSTVSYAAVKSNGDLTTDENGIPGKEFLTVIYPVSDAATLSETIFNHNPAGMQSYGDIYATVTDEDGFPQVIRWSYATEVPIYWTIQITKDVNYPIDGDTLVAAAVLAYGTSLNTSEDVLNIGAVNAIHDNVQGVKNAVIYLGRTASPTGIVPITMLFSEISTHTAANISVSSS